MIRFKSSSVPENRKFITNNVNPKFHYSCQDGEFGLLTKEVRSDHLC